MGAEPLITESDDLGDLAIGAKASCKTATEKKCLACG